MLMPSIFGEDLFDDFMRDFPFYDDKQARRAEKKLYGHRGRNLMKTDIRETDGSYELEMDLPGFTKPRIRMRKPIGMGVDSHYAATIAYDRKGYWFNAGNKAVNWALSKERLINWGLYDLTTAYQSLHVNY